MAISNYIEVSFDENWKLTKGAICSSNEKIKIETYKTWLYLYVKEYEIWYNVGELHEGYCYFDCLEIRVEKIEEKTYSKIYNLISGQKLYSLQEYNPDPAGEYMSCARKQLQEWSKKYE